MLSLRTSYAPFALALPLILAAGAAAESHALPPEIPAFVAKHCAGCHSDAEQKAGLNLVQFRDELAVLKGKKAWDGVIDMLDADEMPPKDKPPPSAEELEKFKAAVKGVFDRAAKSGQVDPGRVTVRRLNRNEYDNTIRDLVGLDLKPAEDFPSDDVGHGFDNIGDVLTISDVLMERYLSAAEGIMTKAIVLTPPKPVERWMSGRYLEPAGGGVKPEHVRLIEGDKTEAIFGGPLHQPYKVESDGEFVFKLHGWGESGGDQPVKVAILQHAKDGLENSASEDDAAKLLGPALAGLKPFRVLAIEELPPKDKRKTLEVKFATNIREFRLAVALVKPADGQPAPKMHIENFYLQGPLDTRPTSQRKLLAVSPDKPREQQTADVLRRFATRAFRRPATDVEIERLTKLVEQVTASGQTWEAGMQYAFQAVLCSPKFLFRLELDESSSPKDSHPLNEYQLASRLSYFLWATMPDDELFALAAKNELAANLDAQVARMLKDPKAKTLVDNFAIQWLQLGRLRQFAADKKLFPQFNEQLKSAMLRETELFLAEIVREDRSILDLIDADFTYLNEQLARHYGIVDTKGNLRDQKITDRGEPIRGEKFVRVSLPAEQRGGLLTQASILTVTSNPTRTSPVKRGRWVLEQILGTPPPPAPSGVPELDDAKRQLTGTLRDRMQQHRENPACAGCHARMDPIGFAFENYDALGGYRTRDGEGNIDPSGVLPDGKTFQGPKELKAILRDKKHLVARCLTEKMLTYALGRGLEYYDTPAVDKIVAALERDNYKFSTLVGEIAKSDPFRLRRGRD